MQTYIKSLQAGVLIEWRDRAYVLIEDLQQPCEGADWSITARNSQGVKVTFRLSVLGELLYGRVGNRFGQIAVAPSPQ